MHERKRETKETNIFGCVGSMIGKNTTRCLAYTTASNHPRLLDSIQVTTERLEGHHYGYLVYNLSVKIDAGQLLLGMNNINKFTEDEITATFFLNANSLYHL